MADEYIRKDVALDACFDGWNSTPADIAGNIKKLESADVVPVSAYKQVMWERDTAVEQLKQIGKGLGEVMDDVVPVCRCKDCRNCSYDSLFDHYWCNHTLGTRRVKPDDFCSYGERREE